MNINTGRAPAKGGVRLDDFYCYLPKYKFLFEPTGDLWPAVSVDAALPPVPLKDEDGAPVLDDRGKPKMLRASEWLARNRAVLRLPKGR